MLRPLNLTNICINEGELSEVLGIDLCRHGHVSY